MYTENTNNTASAEIVALNPVATTNNTETTSNSDIIQIAYHRLAKYEDNVRTVKPSKQSDKQLLASIRKHGILQNLIVFLDDDNNYKVAGGGRRLDKLSILVNEGHYSKGDSFPCLVTDKENAIALSLHENSGRESMHPADQFMAYKALADKGLSIEDIAIEFGETVTHIKKRLKLSSVAPRLIQYYRNNKLTLDAVMAFTVSDKHQDQLAAYTQLAPHSLNAYRIRSILLDQALDTSDRLVKFVGLKNYQDAGGSTSVDMFENNTTYVNQPDIIHKLAEKALTKQCGKLLVAGWKWADYVLDQDFIIDDMARLETELVGAETIQVEIATLTAEQEKLGDLDWSEDIDARHDEIDNLLEKLESQLERHYVFSDEQKSLSGVTVYCDDNGKLQMLCGRVRPEDMEKAFPNRKNSSKQSTDSTGNQNQDTGIESQALKNNLINYRIQALQSQIALKPALANDLLIFSLAFRLLSNHHSRVLLTNIHSEEETFTETQDIEGTKAHSILQKNKQALCLSWMDAETEAQQFEQFQALSSKQKQKIIAHCVGMSFCGSARKYELQNVLESQLDFDFSSLWQPTAENYFSKLQKKHLLTLGGEVIDSTWKQRNESAKKVDLVTLISKDDAFNDWMPDCA